MLWVEGGIPISRASLLTYLPGWLILYTYCTVIHNLHIDSIWNIEFIGHEHNHDDILKILIYRKRPDLINVFLVVQLFCPKDPLTEQNYFLYFYWRFIQYSMNKRGRFGSFEYLSGVSIKCLSSIQYLISYQVVDIFPK